MIVWLLGALDLLAGLNLLVMSFGFYFETVLMLISAYLIIKGLLFLKDFASFIDLLAGGMMLLGLFTVALPKVLLLIFAVLLFQKGATSFL